MDKVYRQSKVWSSEPRGTKVCRLEDPHHTPGGWGEERDALGGYSASVPGCLVVHWSKVLAKAQSTM